MKFAKLLLAVILTTATTAHAVGFMLKRGGQDGNGGDAVPAAGGKVRFLDLVRNSATIMDLEKLGLVAELRSVLARNPGFAAATYFPTDSNGRTTSVESKILAALNSLTFYRVEQNLPETGDRGVVVLPWTVDGKIERLGWQDRATFKVLVDGRFFDRMPRSDQAAFVLHEVLIRVYSDDGVNPVLPSTEKIAALVKATFEANDGLSARAVSRYLCDASIMAQEDSRFGLRRLPGILASGTLYPENTVAFLNTEGRCRVLDLQRTGPATMAAITPLSADVKKAGVWTFATPDVNGGTASASLKLIFLATGELELEFVADLQAPNDIWVDSLVMKKEWAATRLHLWSAE